MIDGVILLDKHKFVTSNKLLTLFKRKIKIKKAGLMGILDPLATGILPIILGEATKYITYIENDKKSYKVSCKLGFFSECGDYESQPKFYKDERKIISILNVKTIEKTLETFIGEYMQVPPMFSNTKYKGKPLYTYARKDIEIKRMPKKRQIYSLDFISLEDDVLELSVTCSSGTYIRTLIQDISKMWKLHSCLYALHRTKVQPFDNYPHVILDNLNIDNFQKYLISIPKMLSKFPKIICSKSEINSLYNGLHIEAKENTTLSCPHLIIDTDDTFYGVGIFKDNYLYPKRLMKR